jgi:hypothetical protein
VKEELVVIEAWKMYEPLRLALPNTGCAVAEPVFVESACEVAVTVTFVAAGGTAGAVYTPLGEIVPVTALPPTTPLTSQVTDELLEFETVAINCRDVPAGMVANAGETETLICPGGGGGFPPLPDDPDDPDELDEVPLLPHPAATINIANTSTKLQAVYRVMFHLAVSLGGLVPGLQKGMFLEALTLYTCCQDFEQVDRSCSESGTILRLRGHARSAERETRAPLY